jgi:hypothetical protein
MLFSVPGHKGFEFDPTDRRAAKAPACLEVPGPSIPHHAAERATIAGVRPSAAISSMAVCQVTVLLRPYVCRGAAPVRAVCPSQRTPARWRAGWRRPPPALAPGRVARPRTWHRCAPNKLALMVAVLAVAEPVMEAAAQSRSPEPAAAMHQRPPVRGPDIFRRCGPALLRGCGTGERALGARAACR